MEPSFKRNNTIPKEIEDIATVIVDSGYKVHLKFGPGLLEKVYETCLAYELRKRGLHVETQVKIPVKYDEIYLDTGFRADMIVQNKVLLEIKCVDSLMPVHEAQLLTYLKLTEYRIGFLINFNTILFQDGIIRRVKKV